MKCPYECGTVIRYYYKNTIFYMKQLINKEDVAKAIHDLNSEGKKATLAAIHAALGNRGSMSTVIRLKGEIEAATQVITDSHQASKVFREFWGLALEQCRKEQEVLTSELRDNLKTLFIENERLDGALTAAQTHADDLDQAKSRLESQLNQAQTALVETAAQTTQAFQKLLRIPMISDTHSNSCRTPFRGCRTVFGAKRRSEGSLTQVSDRKQDIRLFFCPFGTPPRGDALLANLGGYRAVYSGGR